MQKATYRQNYNCRWPTFDGLLCTVIVGFNVPLDTLQVISEMIFPASCLTVTSKPNLAATKLQHKKLNNRFNKPTHTKLNPTMTLKPGLCTFYAIQKCMQPTLWLLGPTWGSFA